MFFDNTVHLDMADNTSYSGSEWVSATTARPRGFGRLRLGPYHHIFIAVLFHQLHCLRRMEEALVDPDSMKNLTYEHALHCYNYLRQTLLCEATDVLEPGDFMSPVHVPTAARVCRNWEAAFEVADSNFDQWSAWEQNWH
jgi:hypothetical protein